MWRLKQTRPLLEAVKTFAEVMWRLKQTRPLLEAVKTFAEVMWRLKQTRPLPGSRAGLEKL